MYLAPFRRIRRSTPLMHLQDAVSSLFDDLLSWPAGDRGWAPALEVSEQEDSIIVKAELPGVKPDEIGLSVEDSVLTISGQKKEEVTEEGEGHYHCERRYGTFRRTIPLPASVDPEKIEATSKDGVLTITLPKAETGKRRRIEIKSE